uniref:Uncharacterized protein n=1 Tax=Opuntia streptacantha TaxID=393608 RepID=A0A7C8Z8F8_OPUST
MSYNHGAALLQHLPSIYQMLWAPQYDHPDYLHGLQNDQKYQLHLELVASYHQSPQNYLRHLLSPPLYHGHFYSFDPHLLHDVSMDYSFLVYPELLNDYELYCDYEKSTNYNSHMDTLILFPLPCHEKHTLKND